MIDIRRLTALSELIAAVSAFEEDVLSGPFDDDEDAIAEVQLDIARAFLRFCGIPAHPEEMGDSLELSEQFEERVRAQAAVYRKTPIPSELRWAVFRRDQFTCKQCGIQEDLHADHIVPESKGGPTTFENLQTLCGDCNRKKGARS